LATYKFKENSVNASCETSTGWRSHIISQIRLSLLSIPFTRSIDLQWFCDECDARGLTAVGLVGKTEPKFGNRAHFFAASEAMRRILADKACGKRIRGHGSDQQCLDRRNCQLANLRINLQ